MSKFMQKVKNGVNGMVNLMQGKSGFSSLESIVEQYQTMYGLGNQQGIGWLSALGSIQYYKLVAPISIGVDLIAQQCADIPLSIWDCKNKVWLKDGDVQGTPQKMFDLLKKTDYAEPYSEFIKKQVSYRLITGNCFTICVTGGISNEPIELITAKPQHLIIMGSGTSYAQRYRWTDGSRSMDFDLDLTTMRYTGIDKLGNKWEIMHSKDFNPLMSTGNLWGMSKLTPIYNEMEEYIAGVVHNKNLLKNGARPSGVLTMNEEMTADNYEKTREQVRRFYQGEKNAGGVLIFEGDGSRFESFSISPRDMDFASLHDRVERTLYNRLNIPSPLLKDTAMTYNNLDSALYQLYILASNPLLSEFLLELDTLLDDKYKDALNYKLGIDPIDVLALKPRQIEDNSKLSKSAFITIDENRKMFGYDPLEEGGDKLYIPSGFNEFLTDEERATRMQDFMNKQGDKKQSDNEVETTKKDGSKKDKKDGSEKKSLAENLARFFEVARQQKEEDINIQTVVEEVENLYGRD